MALNTSWNLKKLIEILREESFDVLFINLPQEFEPYLKKFKELQRVATFYAQELNALESLINNLKTYNLNIKLHCYVDNEHARKKREIDTRLLNLVLKAKLGKTVVEEWKETIMDDINSNKDFAEYEALSIIEKSGKNNACIGLNEEIERFLIEEGYEVKRLQLYDFKRPIDKLYSLVKREMRGEIIDNSEFVATIRQHIKFIDAVIEIGYEEACKIIWDI